MKTYVDRFVNHIDMTDGSVVIDEEIYKQIQLDAYKQACTDMAELLDKLEPEHRYGDCGNDTELHAKRSGELDMKWKINKAILFARDNKKEI